MYGGERKIESGGEIINMRREFKKKSRILLIDDNYEHLVGVRELLSLEGSFDVVAVKSGLVGISFVVQRLPPFVGHQPSVHSIGCGIEPPFTVDPGHGSQGCCFGNHIPEVQLQYPILVGGIGVQRKFQSPGSIDVHIHIADPGGLAQGKPGIGGHGEQRHQNKKHIKR